MKKERSEMPYKEWVWEEANRLGVTFNAIHMRVHRGHYPKLKLRRVNKRLVFVKLPVDATTV